MSDVQLVGRAEDARGRPVDVCVEGEFLLLRAAPVTLRFGRQEAEEFAQMFVRGCWEAAQAAGEPSW